MILYRKKGSGPNMKLWGTPLNNQWKSGRVAELYSLFYFLQRLASLLIVSQLVNQVTEVVIPFLVDRFISAPNRNESEDDPQEDKFRNQRTLPVFPVSI